MTYGLSLGFRRLQTADDESAERINRGYKTEVYTEAVRILSERKIDTVTHIMIGLPEEGEGELNKTVELLGKVKPWGVKIHSVYVAKGTALAKMYERGEYTPIDMELYAKRAAFVLYSIPKDTVVHRITGDCPRELLLAPDWNKDKNKVIEKINEELKALYNSEVR